MKDKPLLSITSLLSIVLFTFHWTDDMVREFATGGVSGLSGVLIVLVWRTDCWCSANGDRGASSCSSRRFLGWASSPST